MYKGPKSEGGFGLPKRKHNEKSDRCRSKPFRLRRRRLRDRPRSSPRIRSPARRWTPRHTYGAIDLGTNNCRLLVARPTEDGFTVIDAFSRVVRLGEGMATSGQDQRGRDGPRRRRARRLRREIAPPPGQPGPLGRDRGLPPRRQRPPFRRAGAARDRHLPRDHRARGGSAAGHARLPPPARARRRPGPDLRHRRRLDRIGPDRHRPGRAADQMLVERALGRGLADRERGPRFRHHRGAARRLWPDARARPPRLPPFHRIAAREARTTSA